MTESVNESSYNSSLIWNNVDEPIVKYNVDWQEILLAIVLCILIVVTVVGNTLVIIAVSTTRRLRTVTNCYVMSLAVADFLVGVFVMPPAVAVRLMGRGPLWLHYFTPCPGSWELGTFLCDIWISLDVMCCTASILSLCAISLDRYLAVTQPLNYSRRRRSKKLALIMILVVWLAAIAITCPPIFGWYDNTRHSGKTCRYNQNKGYVIFSAMGSFFIPLIVMLYVYARISCVVAKRHDKLGGAAHGSKRSQRFLNCNDESECLERGSLDGEDGHPSVVKCTSLTGEQYTTTLHPQRSVRSHHPHYQYPQHLGTDLCTYNARLSFYGTGNRTSRPESLIVDIGPTYGLGKCESSSRVSSFRRESKTTRTLSIVVGGFVACWLPFFITYLITPFLVGPVPILLMTLLTWLGWVNSAINPFIYAFYSVDFRTAFWRLTFRHCSKNEKSQQFVSRNK